MRRRTQVLIALCLLAGCASTPPSGNSTAPSSSNERYSYVLGGNVAGHQVVRRSADLAVIDFEYNDRGRGPKISTELRFDSRGVPISLRTTGVDYLKGPVDETLTVRETTATWKSSAERGAMTVGEAKPYFVSMFGPPGEYGFLARALLDAPGQHLSILPAGEASIRNAGSLKVSREGESRTVHHYTISGLALSPVDVWLDADRSLFALPTSWATLIREGWEGSIDALLREQERSAAARFADAARRLARKSPSGAIAITGARLFDSESATTRAGITVLVRGNTIAAVGPDGSIEIPADALRIDARGKTLLPGLWDSHAHLGPDDGILDIAAGVTTVRDLANDIDYITSLRDQFERGTQIGPRVILAGFIDSPGPYAGPSKVLVSTDEEVRAAIDRYASLGYEQIKVYSSLKPELLEPLIEYAHSKGLRVSGHIPATLFAEDVVRAGFDEIQHVNMLFLNFYRDVTDTRTPARFLALGDRAASFDFDDPAVRSFIELLKTRGTVVDPTVAVFEGMFGDRPGVISAGFLPVADRFPPQVQRTLKMGGLPVTADNDARYRAVPRQMLRFVAELDRAGVTVVAGTDGFAGFTLHRELELYAIAGIPPGRVLQMATIVPARVMKRDARLGSIAPGKLADMILVDGDPTTDITRIRRVETVIKDGTIFSSRELYAELGIKPE